MVESSFTDSSSGQRMPNSAASSLSGPPEAATVADGVLPAAALVALATIVTEVETADGTLDAVVSDVTFGPDFDAFAEGVVLMQESACGLDAMLASE